MAKNYLWVIILTTLSSCGIYTKYERQEVDTEGLFGNISIMDTSSIADLAWRDLVTDPQLQTLIEKGLAANTDLQVARLRTLEAQASLRKAKLAYLPSLSLDAEGNLSRFDGENSPKTYAIQGTASWEVDLFGKLTNAKREALAELEESEAYSQAVETQLIATIADNYYSLLAKDEQLAISMETLTNWRDYVHTIRVLMKAGDADMAAVNQAEANCLSAETSVVTLQEQINELENTLSLLLAETPHAISRGKLSEQEFPDTLLTGVPLKMLERRPDVRQAEAQLVQAFYATNSARSAFYPSITLSGSAGWTNDGTIVTNPGAWLLQAIGSLVQPLFNRGENIANLQIAKAQQEEALLSFRQSLLDAGAEVNDALVQWQSAQKRIRLEEEQIGYLQESVRTTRLLMEHGNNNYLEVLTAQQSLLQTQLTLSSDQYEAIQGIINLYHALGGK